MSARESKGRASGCARESGPAIGPKGGSAGARERGGGRDMGQIWPNRGEKFFLFLFIFSNSFPFLFLFFLNKLFSR